MGSSKMMRGALRSSRVVRLDWVALGNKVTSDAGKLELANLRAAYSEIVKTTSSAPATTPQVDWAKWKATIKTPGVVDDFQAAFGKLSAPAPPRAASRSSRRSSPLTQRSPPRLRLRSRPTSGKWPSFTSDV